MKLLKESKKLYKLGADGNIRVWWVCLYEENGFGFLSTVHGHAHGVVKETDKTLIAPTNVGRANHRSSFMQANFEYDSMIADKLSRGRYTTDPSGVLDNPSPKPMLAKDFNKYADKIWEDKSIVCQQPKLDGIRCLANRDGMWTRQGKDISSCPHILGEIQMLLDLLPPDSFLDGELYNHDLRDNFQKITSLVRKTKTTKKSLEETEKLVQYHVYDVSGTEQFWVRYANFFIAASELDLKYIKLTPTFTPVDDEDIATQHQFYLANGYEGSIIRWGLEGYEEKRSNHLLKLKNFDADEFKVVNIMEGKGNWQGAAKRFELKLPSGRTFGAGVKGEKQELEKLWKNSRTPDWATVRYFGTSNDGVPRFPVVVDFGWGERND